jgi:2-polyprenyl-3-methyl-5-hydroxy-6-metoxy-1,4-benzoquinol methylase
MAQVTTGIRAVLSNPLVYNALQNLLGAETVRARIVRDHVRPFPGMRILDLGCGTAEILRALPMDITYVGYDMSPEYIADAQQRFAGRGTFHCRLLEQTEVATLEPFDLVMGIGVLHHLDDATARQFMLLARSALCRGGRIYTLDPCYATGQNPIARFLISRDRGQHVRDIEGYRVLTRDLGADVSGTLVHKSWIPYTHWHMECRVSAAETPSCAKAAIGDF